MLRDRLLDIMNGVVEEKELPPTDLQRMKEILKSIKSSVIPKETLEELKQLKDKLDCNNTDEAVEWWTTTDLLLDAHKVNNNRFVKKKKIGLPSHIDKLFIEKLAIMIEEYRRKYGKNKIVKCKEFFKSTGLCGDNFGLFTNEVFGRFTFNSYEYKGEDVIELIPWGYISNRD